MIALRSALETTANRREWPLLTGRDFAARDCERTVGMATCSPLWPIRWVFTNRLLGWAFERAVGHRTQVF